MAAFVWSGRRRPKVRNSRPSDLMAPRVMVSRNLPFICHQLSWVAAMKPTRRPTTPQMMEARVNLRTVRSSNSMVVLTAFAFMDGMGEWSCQRGGAGSGDSVEGGSSSGRRESCSGPVSRRRRCSPRKAMTKTAERQRLTRRVTRRAFTSGIVCRRRGRGARCCGGCCAGVGKGCADPAGPGGSGQRPIQGGNR